MKLRPVLLIILDGFGLSPHEEGNAVALAATPNLDHWFVTAPHSRLCSSGEEVGLAPGQMGDSNVGHLNLGAGRVVCQDVLRISRAVASGEFDRNPVLRQACEAAGDGRLHLIGLVSDGGVHSHQDHLQALIKLARSCGVGQVLVHALLDGRDVAPVSAPCYLQRLQQVVAGAGKIASISGRYYAMDRDQRWDRVRRAYEAIVLARGPVSASPGRALAEGYGRGETDEFLTPTVIEGSPGVDPDDVVILFNFRADRARQLSRALADPDFDAFPRPAPLSRLVTMTLYDEQFPLPHAFPPAARPRHGLGEWLSRHGKRQLRIAETEKYAHVTYFFSGGEEEPYSGEKRRLIPSPRVATYDLQPQMSAVEVTAAVLEELEHHDVIILNYANPDMVGHTGVLEAAVEAVATVDRCLGRVVTAVSELGGACLIVADHGNVEQMLEPTGEPHTAHTTNPVPALLVAPGLSGVRLADGILADVAPTVLELAGLVPPVEMSGKSLLLHPEEGSA